MNRNLQAFFLPGKKTFFLSLSVSHNLKNPKISPKFGPNIEIFFPPKIKCSLNCPVSKNGHFQFCPEISIGTRPPPPPLPPHSSLVIQFCTGYKKRPIFKTKFLFFCNSFFFFELDDLIIPKKKNLERTKKVSQSLKNKKKIETTIFCLHVYTSVLVLDYIVFLFKKFDHIFSTLNDFEKRYAKLLDLEEKMKFTNSNVTTIFFFFFFSFSFVLNFLLKKNRDSKILSRLRLIIRPALLGHEF